MRPLGPVPVMVLRSRLAARARRRTSGVANTRSDASTPASPSATIPSACIAASRSSIDSPGAHCSAIASPTSTRVPGSTRNLTISPGSSASMSTWALSVSTVATTSDWAKETPWCTCHSVSTADDGIGGDAWHPQQRRHGQAPTTSVSLAATSSVLAMAARSSTLLMLGDASPPVTRSTGWSSQSK